MCSLCRRGNSQAWFSRHYDDDDSQQFMLALSAVFAGIAVLGVLLFVYKWLDVLYTNMALAAARDGDKAGLHCLHRI